MGSCSSAHNKEDFDEKSLILLPTEIELVRKSWKLVVETGLTKYGTTMMVRVFIEHKELKPLWRFSKGLDSEEQMNGSQALKVHGEKLFNAFDMAIHSLDDFNTLVPILIQLGYTHYKFGVREEHFGYIGDILIGTLQDGLKEQFSPKVKKAWIKVFGIVASHMKIGLKQCESESKSPKNHIQPMEMHKNNDVNLDTNGKIENF